MDVPVAANVLGTLGAVCWSVQLIPQIVTNYRRHDTTGLQPTMMLLWAVAGIPLGVYNIVQSFNVALLVQPQILTALSLATWVQCKYYDPSTKWSWQKCTLVSVPLGLLLGGIEAGLVFALHHGVSRGIHWPITLMAVLSAVLLCAGVLRHYWDIYKERTVRGISFLFVGIDAMGDLTSLISVLFQPKPDILGLVIYGSELVLWLGVFACGGWYNLRPYMKQFGAKKKQAIPHRGDVPGMNVSATEAPEVLGDESRSIHSTKSQRSVATSSSSVFRTAARASSTQDVRLRSVAQV